MSTDSNLFLSLNNREPVRLWDVFTCQDTIVYYKLGTLFKRWIFQKFCTITTNISRDTRCTRLYIIILSLSCVPGSLRPRAAVCWEEVFIKTTQCLHPLRCTDGFCWTLSFNTWGKSSDAQSLQTFDKVKEVLKAPRVYKAGYNSSSSRLGVSAEAICNQQCVPAGIQWRSDRTVKGVLEKTIFTLCSHWFLNLKYFL